MSGNKNVITISFGQIPFDLHYAPDLVFYAPEKVVVGFPDDIGKGRLFIKPCLWCNFSELCLLIDNFVVQFSPNGGMYIYDIINNSYKKIHLNSISDTGFERWILQVSDAAKQMNKVYKENQKAKNYLIIFTSVMFHFTYKELDKASYLREVNNIKGMFGMSSTSNRLEIRNRAWYFEGKKQTWGHVAHCIFRDEFKAFLDFH